MTWTAIGVGLDPRLAELEADVARVRGQYGSAERALQDAHGQVRRLEGELVVAERDDILAGGGSKAAPKAHAAIEKARLQIPELTRRIEAHRQAVVTAEQRVRSYAADHRAEILAAQYARGEQARDAVYDAVRGLQHALGAFRAVTAQSIALESVFTGLMKTPDALPAPLSAMLEDLPELPVPAPAEMPPMVPEPGDGNDADELMGAWGPAGRWAA